MIEGIRENGSEAAEFVIRKVRENLFTLRWMLFINNNQLKKIKEIYLKQFCY